MSARRVNFIVLVMAVPPVYPDQKPGS
jgi:hypothetical protein